MSAASSWIPARRFRPQNLAGLIWRGLRVIAPNVARQYLDHLMQARMRNLRRAPQPVVTPIALVGGFDLNIGIGRAARILCAGLKAADIPLHKMDCGTLLRPPPGPTPPLPAAPARGTLVFCVNPPRMTKLIRHFGPDICRDKRLVGYWWWELDRVPRKWLRWAALMDELWVSSRFIHETFARALPGKPIRYLPLPVPEPVPSAASRTDFSLAIDRFTVLVAFDLASGWERKNPLGAITAFRRAFPSAMDAQLVLKVSGAEACADQMERLRVLTADMANVRIIDRSLPADDLAALIHCADVLLSLHRSEGLGLFIAEAMWLGTPVVATGWSGVMDMLDADNSVLVRFKKVPVRTSDYPSVPPGVEWAEPDIAHAVECLRQLAADPVLRVKLSTKARRRAERQFSLDEFRKLAPSLLQPPGGPSQ
jgi:glycosyltransferase involved in cell wall biosynthesis